MAVGSVCIVLIVWQTAAMLSGRDSGGQRIVPSIDDVIRSFKLLAFYWKGGFGVESTLFGAPITYKGAVLSLLHNSGVTGLRVGAGLTLGIGCGVGLAVAVSWSLLLRRMFLLSADFTRMLPLLAMVPLFSLWFGDQNRGAIIFIAFGVAVLLFAVTLNAIGNVPSYYQHFAQSLGARNWRTYFTVILPACFPQLRAGLLLALGFAWSAAIAAEFLGQQYGLGSIVVDAQLFGRTNLLALVGVIVLIYSSISFLALAAALAWITRWAE